MRFHLISIIILSFTISLAAEDIATDRPDQTETSRTIPHKSIQVETGFSREMADAGDANVIATLIRVGVLNGFELRFEGAYLSNGVSGFEPVTIGFKTNVCEQSGLLPETAIITSFAVPALSSDEFKSDYIAPLFRLSCSNEIENLFTIGYNLGIAWNGNTADPTSFYTLALGRDITDNIGFYAEVFGNLNDEIPPVHMIDGGFTYKMTSVIQFDISGGFAITESSPNSYFALGFSFRVD